MPRSLFEFATSELSQDAFLCWIVANADAADRPDLRDLGRAFIAWLWTRARGVDVDPAAVRLASGPRRQVNHVDIMFDADVGGLMRTFIIEDKTFTSQHSGQLERYVGAVGDGRDVVPVYFKTGYHFSIDVSAATHGYAVVGLKEWVAFLEAHPVRNDIVADYLACMRRQLDERDAVLGALMTAEGHQRLRHDYAQFELMKQLAAKCTDGIGATEINRGVSVGGAPWTHFRFASFKAVLPSGIDEALFHRIDARNDETGKRRYYLSTRQYAVVKGNAQAQAAKLARRRQHTTAFARAVATTRSPLNFARPSTDRRGANESEIGILFFDEGTNTVSSVMDTFAAVHAAFVRELRP